MCFVIYSGEKDQYVDKLNSLIDKILEVIRNAENAHPSLIILIFFLIRILIIRLSPTNFKSLLKNTWPPLISLFIHIYSTITNHRT